MSVNSLLKEKQKQTKKPIKQKNPQQNKKTTTQKTFVFGVFFPFLSQMIGLSSYLASNSLNNWNN